MELYFNGVHRGLFYHLLCAAEYLHAFEQGEIAPLYLNLSGYLGRADIISELFLPFPDSDKRTCAGQEVDSLVQFGEAPHKGIKRVSRFPREYNLDFSLDTNAEDWRGDAARSLYRERMAPILARYFKPRDDLQKRANDLVAQLTASGRRTLGFHVSGATNLNALTRTFCSLLRKHGNVVVYLATLCQPVVDRLRQYCADIYVQPIPRQSNLTDPWYTCGGSAPEMALVDAIVLAACDMVHGVRLSNMLTWVACSNTKVPISVDVE